MFVATPLPVLQSLNALFPSLSFARPPLRRGAAVVFDCIVGGSFRTGRKFDFVTRRGQDLRSCHPTVSFTLTGFKSLGSERPPVFSDAWRIRRFAVSRLVWLTFFHPQGWAFFPPPCQSLPGSYF